MNIKELNYEKLYDMKVSRVDAVELRRMREGEKVSIISDVVFKTMLFNNKRIKYSAKLISYFIDVDFDILVNNIKLCKNELDKNKNSNKSELCDYVAIINDSKINIEINNNSDISILERNMDYLFKLYSSNNKKGGDYNFSQTIQLNINNFSFIGNDNIIDYYLLKNDNNTVLSDKIVIINIYVPNLRRKWYNLGINGLDEKERYILSLIDPDIDISLEIGKDIDIVMDYIDELKDVMNDNSFGQSYDHELANQELYIEQGIKIGIEQGKEIGIEQERKNYISKLLDNNFDIDTIVNLTGIEINNVKEIINNIMDNK